MGGKCKVGNLPVPLVEDQEKRKEGRTRAQEVYTDQVKRFVAAASVDRRPELKFGLRAQVH